MILAIDTSTPHLSLALRRSGQTLGTVNGGAQHAVPLQRRHNESILPHLDELLRQAGTTVKALTGVAVGLGPGSFTGVRVGIATGLGLAQALEIPIIGVSSFLAIAAGTSADSVLVVEDARQDHFYTAWYARKNGWEAEIPEILFSLEALEKNLPAQHCQVSGPAAPLLFERMRLPEYFSLAPETERFPRAEIIAQLVDGTLASTLTGRLAAGGMAPDQLVPIYLRKTQAEEMLKI
jgi:tRNA threonylcarbamoyladenosine biosynthesis protein TsaB